MILFARTQHSVVYVVGVDKQPGQEDTLKLEWLFGGTILDKQAIRGCFIGPRKEMISPWSTNAVEITQNMGITGVNRIEAFREVDNTNTEHDPMLEVVYTEIDQTIFDIDIEPDAIKYIDNIAAYNQEEGLALNDEEVAYLESMSQRIGRSLTDSEVFGFSQVNSEHCRHKIFNGTFIIDGDEKEKSLFQLIKKTSADHKNRIVSAYKDNVAFVEGPEIEQFAPEEQDKPAYFTTKSIKSVISIKAETHNFPTTVEPFNGAATGSGGEIRDRLAGGKAAIPLAGTAVYMTPYSRQKGGKNWETSVPERAWLYQSPVEILIKASNGASDFGNKFGQPLINGSLLTFEHEEDGKNYGYDKVIMLAGGVGYARLEDSKKDIPKAGDQIVIMGGDNYRIGMGGSAVSSVATGEFSNSIELNAIQRSNPEMQKRVANTIRAMAERDENPIVSIHDHGAGGHLNCLSELVEETGGTIEVRKLPIGDKTLSAKEIIGNESQERMGLVIDENNYEKLKAVAERERAPIYAVGQTTGDMKFQFRDDKTNESPINLQLSDFFGNSPKTVLNDSSIAKKFAPVSYDKAQIDDFIIKVLQLEGVACKDWLTNKVDRSVSGRVAKQQTCGEIQLPLNNLGVMALDFRGIKGVANAIGHAPVAALIDPKAGSQLAIAESLSNLVWAPIEQGLSGVSLSANWMWPAKNEGEDARLYAAVESVSHFACELGINIPTGKDSLSMVQKYPDGNKVYAPGTVIISAAGEVTDVRKVVETAIDVEAGGSIVYVDLSLDDFHLGGSAFAQMQSKVGDEVPAIKSTTNFKSAFKAIQDLIQNGDVLAGHDVSGGGLITSLLEMCFPGKNTGMSVDLDVFQEQDVVKLLFSEKPALLIQVKDAPNIVSTLEAQGVAVKTIAVVNKSGNVELTGSGLQLRLEVAKYRDIWFKTSYLLDKHQAGIHLAEKRYENYKNAPIIPEFPSHFDGSFESLGINPDRKEKSGVKAAIIREKGVNGDREMAYVIHLAGFDVKDVHMTDLISGRETLEDIGFIVFVGGFSNSDVLGSAKGWAGAFRYNEKAKSALERFYQREDTLSLGVCNGCQLMVELGLIDNSKEKKARMLHNDSHKFESSFLNVTIQENDSVMLKSLQGAVLGVWVAHGEGKFELPENESSYNIAMKYMSEAYPVNPNGSDYNTAAIYSRDGRHLAMMPHLERAFYPWQCAYYPGKRKNDDCTPWLEAFVNAKRWIEGYAD